jgi:hypothetical protein
MNRNWDLSILELAKPSGGDKLPIPEHDLSHFRIDNFEKPPERSAGSSAEELLHQAGLSS